MRVHTNAPFCRSRGNTSVPTIVADGDFTVFFARGFDAYAYMNLGGVRLAVDGPPRLAVFPAG
jgi:hypothetical protein